MNETQAMRDIMRTVEQYENAAWWAERDPSTRASKAWAAVNSIETNTMERSRLLLESMNRYDGSIPSNDVPQTSAGRKPGGGSSRTGLGGAPRA